MTWKPSYLTVSLVVAQGLAVLGYRVMETVGHEITEINFSRGFAVELGSTLSVVLASVIGESADLSPLHGLRPP